MIHDLLVKLESVERDYITLKLDYELKESRMWLELEFDKLLNKAKPTQKDKENYIKIELIGDKMEVEQIRATYDSLKREFKVKLLEYEAHLQNNREEMI